jgi:hypothetical protein
MAVRAFIGQAAPPSFIGYADHAISKVPQQRSSSSPVPASEQRPLKPSLRHTVHESSNHKHLPGLTLGRTPVIGCMPVSANWSAASLSFHPPKREAAEAAEAQELRELQEFAALALATLAALATGVLLPRHTTCDDCVHRGFSLGSRSLPSH